MKTGFRVSPDGTVYAPMEQAQLFAKVPNSGLRNLCGGFGNDVRRYFEILSVFTSDVVATMGGSDLGELRGICDAIERRV